MSNVTVKELDDLIGKMVDIDGLIKGLEDQITAYNKELAAIKTSATNYLNELGRSEYDSPYGKIKFAPKYNVRLPQGDAKTQFFAWMKEQGIFEKYATVNASSYKSLFLAERETAVENGADPMTWSLPGTEPATVFIDLKYPKSRRKGASEENEQE